MLGLLLSYRLLLLNFKQTFWRRRKTNHNEGNFKGDDYLIQMKILKREGTMQLIDD